MKLVLFVCALASKSLIFVVEGYFFFGVEDTASVLEVAGCAFTLFHASSS